MSERLPQQALSGERAQGATKDVALLLLSLAIMVGSIATYWLYPFPGGIRPSIWGFVALFFREALLLTFFSVVGLVVVVLAGIGAIGRLLPRLGGRKEKPK